MIRNEVKVIGLVSKEDLSLISSEDVIIESFNFELNHFEDLNSVYELTLNVDSFNLNTITFKNSTINTISFRILAKVLYSKSNNTIIVKDFLLPYIYNLKTASKVSKLTLIDCNLSVNFSSISLSLLVGFIKEKTSINIYKTKNYITTQTKSDFNSTFDFL